MEFIALATALVVAGGLGGLAWGYRNERDDGREQIRWLRGELARANDPSPPAGSRQLTTIGGQQ